MKKHYPLLFMKYLYYPFFTFLLLTSGLLCAQDIEFFDYEREREMMDSLYRSNPDISRREVQDFMIDYQNQQIELYHQLHIEQESTLGSVQNSITNGAASEGQVPDSVEYAALAAIYNATDGDNWNINTNWLQGTTNVDFSTWHGVRITSGDVSSLTLKNNNLNGSIPSYIGALTELSALFLNDNKITSIPPEIGNLTRVNFFTISSNQLTIIPSEIGNMLSLNTLVLSDNLLASIPPKLGKLSNLKALYFDFNQLTNVPPEIGNLSKLGSLGLSNNSLTSIPLELTTLSNLSSVRLDNNQLTNIPPEIGNLSKLRQLIIGDNQITYIPTSIWTLTNLWVLELSDNQLTSISKEIGKLTDLQHLFLENNQLASIPAEIGNLQALDQLNLSNNKLTSLPAEMGNLSFLRWLYIDHNQLGEIPSELKDLSGLNLLNLSYNQISDVTELEGIKSFELDLSHNRLTTIPSSIITSKDIMKLDVSYNQLDSLPKFDYSYRRRHVENNYIDLNYIARNLTAPVNPALTKLTYKPQNSAPDTITITDETGTTLSPFPYQHPQSNYQWQRQVNGEWQDIAGAVNPTYSASDENLYRCRLTNNWLADMVYYSTIFQVSSNNKNLWYEAECATIGSNWQEVISAQASGGKYVTYPKGSYITAPSENPADQLVYTVSVNEAQNYYLMARINAPSYGDDSFWFKMDDNDWIRWSSGITVNKGFRWNLAPGGPFSLSAGTHTLRIAYREDGIQLDKLTLSPTNTLPTGLGEEAQACADDYTPPAPPTVNNPPDATVAPTVSGTLTPPSQSNSNVNYVRSFTPRTQIESPEDVTMSSNKNDVSISTEYLDGLGRPIQTVVRAGGGRSSRDEDLVQPVAYDAYGRQVKEYLPYAANTATGAYRPNALVEQYQFYTSTGPSDIAKSDYPYAERQYEASPLNRVLEQAAPGENWRIGSGHEVEMQYLVNTESEVRQWTASNNLSVATLSGGTTYYGVGELYKTVTVDENDHTTTEFVNKEGQTVLKRVQGPDGLQDTYYVYNDFNLLRFVLPPEASKQLSSNPAQASNTAFVEQQLYVYTYDGRRRMMSKQVPGGGITRMVYDRWDRLVLTQSPRMRQDNNKQWLYTKYDNLNRPIVTGIYTASEDESDLRTAAMNATGHHERFITSGLNYTLNESFPVTTGTTARTVTYYDDYAFTHASYGNFSAQGTPHRSQVQGQVTGTRVRQLGNRDWLQSVTYYDEQQRPILHLQRNHLGATDRLKTTYRNAVNSEVVATEFKHKTTLAEHTVRERYLHDHQGRLKRTWHRLDNESEVVLSTQSYNALGSVGSKALHVSSGSARQNINYRYNIRGWLTQINDLNQAGSYFNQELYYDFGFEEKQHNGNISGVKWNRAGSKSHAYGYLYDEVNRITGADYRDRAAGSWASAPGAFSVDKVGYDENGNIEQLKRYGLLDERLHLLDDLSYSYQGNRLRAVQDAGEAGAGFVDGAKATDEYSYDEAGNLISDKNKNITGIAYDPVLNLPLRIDFANGSRLEYVYDATGTKLQQKVVQVGGKSKITDYVQGFHYEDSQLSFLQHDEGRLMMEDRAYHYDLKDHLGNSRVTFSSKPVTTTAMASMEMSAAPEEEAVFEGVAESRQTLAFHNTTDPSITEPEPQQVATLMPGEQGPSKSLQVYQGDTVRLKVNARYETTPQQVQGLEGVATEVVGAVQKTASGLESSGVSEGVSGLGATGALANEQQEAPQAYLNYLVYDEDYQLVDQGFVAVSEAAAVGAKNPDAAPEELALEVPIEEDGFVYAYLSNGVANSGTPVHFDDFTVEQQSYIVQVSDLYPFGLTHQQPLPGNLKNRYLFQSAELTQDFGLGWYDFGLRSNYDPTTGRWGSVDPAADMYASHSPYHFGGNNPISNYEVNGAFFDDIYHFAGGGSQTVQTNDNFDRHFYVSAGPNDVLQADQIATTQKGEALNVLSEVSVSSTIIKSDYVSPNVSHANEQLARSLAGPASGAVEPFYFVDNPISVGADVVNQVQGGEYAMAAFTLATLGKGNKVKKVAKYDVGAFNDLQKASAVGDNLDLHHVLQSHPGGQVIPGYDRATAPAIALPTREHKRINTVRGAYTGTARDQLAKDIRDLRRHTNAPNSSLQQLIQLNKQMYPGPLRKR